MNSQIQLVKYWPSYKTMERAGSVKGNKSWESHTECVLVSVRHNTFFLLVETWHWLQRHNTESNYERSEFRILFVANTIYKQSHTLFFLSHRCESPGLCLGLHVPSLSGSPLKTNVPDPRDTISSFSWNNPRLASASTPPKNDDSTFPTGRRIQLWLGMGLVSAHSWVVRFKDLKTLRFCIYRPWATYTCNRSGSSDARPWTIWSVTKAKRNH